jgi:hypothetical protein
MELTSLIEALSEGIMCPVAATVQPIMNVDLTMSIAWRE